VTSAPLRLGTRRSPLALAQAQLVAAAITAEVELVEIATSGDSGGGEDKRRWVDAIESALSTGAIDLAVHSAKDIPAELAPGLELAGSPARADARDSLCGAASLAALPPGARVGTSSLRRTAQLRALRPDLDVVALHGNVGTRMQRLEAGDYDAIILAAAGLERLALPRGTPLDELVPAPGQGTIAIESRSGDATVAAAIADLRDPPTERALLAERTLARALGADCQTPIGAYATVLDAGELELHAFLGRADGSHWIRDIHRGTDPVALGLALADRLTTVGARELLG
jgi:hydroxymethylbilane synthase